MILVSKLASCLQVLAHTVAPIFLAFGTARDTQQSQMLNPLRLPEADAQCQERLQMSAPAAIRGLQWLPRLQDWAMFGVLICPGADIASNANRHHVSVSQEASLDPLSSKCLYCCVQLSGACTPLLAILA